MSEIRRPILESRGLTYLSPKELNKNPQNPRLIFREESMRALRESIAEVGILVPLLIYFSKKDDKYYIVDGERRWRCALELNLEKVPVNIVAEPSLTTNILTMFNIHNVREVWEPMPTALKLEALMRLTNVTNNRKLATLTGLSTGNINRCKKLLSYDKKYQDMLILASKEDRIKADVFVELYPIFRLLKKYLPNVSRKYSKDEITDRFVEKFRAGVISDVIDFRDLAKMIRAIEKGASPEHVQGYVIRLLEDAKLSIKDAYDEAARSIYDLEKMEKVSEALLASLLGMDKRLIMKRPTLLKLLRELRQSLDRILTNI